ncbi:MAG: hypothetical protein R3C03_03225 [Pirellulaceae bacterium]
MSEMLPGPRWVSSLEASRYASGRCYVTFDGHRYDDDEPYVFVTDDFGKTWKSIRGNLPTTAGVTRVIREDIVNENVLYLGCEFSAWVSVDKGANWTQFKSNMPTVAVHDFAQHPSSGEIVLGTHGRGAWIADVTALRQWTPDNQKSAAMLYRPNQVVLWERGIERGNNGPQEFVGENPSRSAHLYYSLGQNANSVELTMTDLNGEVVHIFPEVSAEKGLHHIEWDLRPNRGNTDNQGGGGPGRGGFRGFGGGNGPATYLLTLKVDGAVQTKTLELVADPNRPSDAVGSELTDEEFNELIGIDD